MGHPNEALPAPRHPMVEEGVRVPARWPVLAGKIKWGQLWANLTSRHIVGCINKGGTMKYDSPEVQTPAIWAPPPLIAGAS